MDQQIASKDETNQKDSHIAGEDQFIEQLSKIWLRHQQKDLEVRFKLGEMLNEKLGPPDERQPHGEGTIKRISRELAIDKSDISRLRR